MTRQALQSIDLYRGGNPETIEQLLRFQSSSVVNELKEHFKTDSIPELAARLSLNR